MRRIGDDDEVVPLSAVDAARLVDTRWHAACVALAHREAERLAGP